ncbi:MAG: hypothetical protein ACRDOI_40050 [Trebonia sp.]
MNWFTAVLVPVSASRQFGRVRHRPEEVRGDRQGRTRMGLVGIRAGLIGHAAGHLHVDVLEAGRPDRRRRPGQRARLLVL